MQKKDFNKVKGKINHHIKKITTFKTRHKVFLAVFILLLIILGIDYYNNGLTHYLFSSDTKELSKSIQSFGLIGPLIFIFLVTLEVIIAPIPGIILYITGGAIFGWFWGAILTLTGNMIGAALCFYLAKYLGREFVEKNVGNDKMEIFDKYAIKYGGYAIFFLRINPITSSDFVSYASGFANIRFRDFFLGTFLGLLPLSFAQTYFGYELINISPAVYWLFVILSLAYFFGMIYILYSKVLKEKYKNILKK